MAISADHELGLPTGMVTHTQNDNSPELLAHARRGPCAKPLEEEAFEHLLTRRAPGRRRARIQDDATAAVLSFQRRNAVLKHHFSSVTHARPWGSTPTSGIGLKHRSATPFTRTFRTGTSGAGFVTAIDHAPRSEGGQSRKRQTWPRGWRVSRRRAAPAVSSRHKAPNRPAQRRQPRGAKRVMCTTEQTQHV